jgi:hypothetical protein
MGNRLPKILASEREEVAEDLTKLHNEELHAWYC